jgi:hypothetical protein
MLFDAVAWTLIIVMACAAGAGALRVLGAEQLRAGDRFLLAAWLGVVLLSLALLGASVVVPLAPGTAMVVGGAVAAAGAWAALRGRRSRRRPTLESPIPHAALIAGAAMITAGAAALASDRVTLYDSLVYHVGIMHWLREYGTVPGVALIHNRLGHVSAWLALAAPFDAGPVTHRAANVAMGVALVLAAAQGAVALARIVAHRATGSDWFLLLSSCALIWPVAVYDAASPSPDVAANALIVVVAWSMLVVPRVAAPRVRSRWARWLTPRLVPFVLAVGATTMKLFALPAAVAAAVFYAFGSGEHRGMRDLGGRVLVCCVVGLALAAPFVAANLAASGCPLFPSPAGCLTTPWSVGSGAAADYAVYIREVARRETRQLAGGAHGLPWVGPWVAAHPLVTTLALLAPLLAVVLLRGPRRDGVRSVLLLAVLGIAFAAWKAPAPRFLYAYVLIVPVVAVAYPLATLARRAEGVAGSARPAWAVRSAAARGFIGFALASGLTYALASQKLNLLSAVASGGGALGGRRAELLLPAAPEEPARLYRWRVNDVDVLTPVPLPVADTLSYRSAIDDEAAFEKCSTAPLPCTPYLPDPEVRLREPQRGIAGGFVREHGAVALSARVARCVGAIAAPYDDGALAAVDAGADGDRSAQCGEAASR